MIFKQRLDRISPRSSRGNEWRCALRIRLHFANWQIKYNIQWIKSITHAASPEIACEIAAELAGCAVESCIASPGRGIRDSRGERQFALLEDATVIEAREIGHIDKLKQVAGNVNELMIGRRIDHSILVCLDAKTVRRIHRLGFAAGVSSATVSLRSGNSRAHEIA